MSKFALKDGKFVVNGSGKPILCADCPCGVAHECPSCATPPATTITIPATLNAVVVNGNAGCAANIGLTVPIFNNYAGCDTLAASPLSWVSNPFTLPSTGVQYVMGFFPCADCFGTPCTFLLFHPVVGAGPICNAVVGAYTLGSSTPCPASLSPFLWEFSPGVPNASPSCSGANPDTLNWQNWEVAG